MTYGDYEERNGYDIVAIRNEIVAKLRQRFEYMDYNLYSIELFMNTYKNKIDSNCVNIPVLGLFRAPPLQS